MIKRMIFLKKKPGLSREEFMDHWINKHAEAIKTFPEVKRYVVNCVTDPSGGAPYDGIAELWYEDVESMNKLVASQRFRDFAEEDNLKFQDLTRRWATLVEERTII